MGRAGKVGHLSADRPSFNIDVKQMLLFAALYLNKYNTPGLF